MDNYTPDINNNNNINNGSDENNSQQNNNAGNNQNSSNQNTYWQNNANNGMNNNMYSNNNMNNNFYQNNNPYNMPRPAAKPKDNLALFSLLFGIGSIITSIVYYIGIPLAITAIVLSILSRNRKGRFEGMAVAGLCIGIAGIALGLMFFATMLAMFSNPDMVNYMQEIYNSMNMQ